jgi:hypothetical protein
MQLHSRQRLFRCDSRSFRCDFPFSNLPLCARQGGALHAEKGLGRLLLRGGSRIANNSATDGGGCVAVPGGSVTWLALEGGSALSGCVTQSGDGGALLAATGLRELLLSGGSEVRRVGLRRAAVGGHALAPCSLAFRCTCASSCACLQMAGNLVRDGNGGAVAIRRGDISRISITSGSRICDNSAPSGSGGALWLGGGSIPNAALSGQGTAVCNNTAGVNVSLVQRVQHMLGYGVFMFSALADALYRACDLAWLCRAAALRSRTSVSLAEPCQRWR